MLNCARDTLRASYHQHKRLMDRLVEDDPTSTMLPLRLRLAGSVAAAIFLFRPSTAREAIQQLSEAVQLPAMKIAAYVLALVDIIDEFNAQNLDNTSIV